jgi:diguanylate cyclase (GGDEF)-like protein
VARRPQGTPPPAGAGDTLARLRELEALHDSLRALTATLDLGELLHTVLARMRALLQPQGLSLLLYDRSRDELVYAATELLREDAVLEPGVIDGARLRLDQGIAGWVARHREAVRLDDANRDPRHDAGVARAAGLVPHGMICVPMVHRDRLLGVVQVINRLDGRPFTADEQRLVQSLADYAAVGIAHAQLYRDVELASLTDDLTGLGNTRRFHRDLGRLLAQSPPLSILVLDLDHLKEVVDTHGHLVGSRTIATVGRLIAEQLRPGDVAARFGGDEFVAVLPSTDTDAARDVAERIRAAVAACATPDGLSIDIRDVTASLGVATAPRHASDPDGLFRAADVAMYDVKRRRRNGVAVALG